MGIARSEDLDDFDDDVADTSFGDDIEFIPQEKNKPGRKKSAWRDVEDYLEEKRLKKLLQEEFDL